MSENYCATIEKQDFYEIIENKYGEVAIFIDARENAPDEPILEFDGKSTALLKRDDRIAVILENIDDEAREPLAASEFVMIAELKGKEVNRIYAVEVSNVEEINFKGRRTRADELTRIKTKDELLDNFRPVNCWTSGK